MAAAKAAGTLKPRQAGNVVKGSFGKKPTTGKTVASELNAAIATLATNGKGKRIPADLGNSNQIRIEADKAKGKAAKKTAKPAAPAAAEAKPGYRVRVTVLEDGKVKAGSRRTVLYRTTMLCTKAQALAWQKPLEAQAKAWENGE